MVLTPLLGVVLGTAANAQQLPVFPALAWEERPPASQGVDAWRLQAAVEYLKSNAPRDGVDELVIIRNGFLIWKGPHSERIHGIWSVTKSFTSTVLGLLVDDGRITLDAKVHDVLPALSADYPDVTIRHLITMTSGYQAWGDTGTKGFSGGKRASPFTLSPTPLFSPPGTQFAYLDSSMNQLANVLTRVIGEPLSAFFKRRIGDPIGMHFDHSNWKDFGVVDGRVVNGGSGSYGVDVRTSACELARLGHLFLHRGQWHHRQLLSPAWVDAATRPQVPVSIPVIARNGFHSDGRGTYGFGWWANGVKVDSTRLWPGAPASTYAAVGFNNNRLFVLPDWQMVIVRLGRDQAGGFFFERRFLIRDSIWGEFLRKIGESILPEPDLPR
jgi:CubicO group peptidase (beta-lactamase class C family)